MCVQFAHFGMAATIIFASALLASQYFVYFLIALLVWATVKEMWFDPHFEHGGSGNGAKVGKPDVEDFLFYVAGICFALIVLQVSHLLIWPHW
jgi:hypothetical protein